MPLLKWSSIQQTIAYGEKPLWPLDKELGLGYLMVKLTRAQPTHFVGLVYIV